MRKEVLGYPPEHSDSLSGPWFDLEALGRVRLTSEDAAHPVEHALQNSPAGGWRAASSGEQTIWIHFDTPQTIAEIQLRFEVTESRTQEFVLQASNDGGASYRDIVRQQFNFSAGTTVEDEHYFLRQGGITDLKLVIIPDISGGDARATLRTLRIR
jgi:hypothetical protein